MNTDQNNLNIRGTQNIDRNVIGYATKLLSEGKLVAFPTETVYGLGGDARNPVAVQKIYAVKNRPPTNPLIIHLSSISAIEDYALDIPNAAYILAEAFWPGPLTMVLPKHPSVLSSVTANQNSVALRIPNHPVALALLEEFGGGIAAPSANRYSCLSPTRALHVRKGLGEDVDFILDGGDCTVGIESTIVSLLGSQPVILRQGHVKQQDIENVLGVSLSERDGIKRSHIEKQGHLEKRRTVGKRKCVEKTSNIEKHNHIVVPGQSLKHYAPSKPLYLLSTSDLKRKLQESTWPVTFSVLSYSQKEEFYAEDFCFEKMSAEKLCAEALYAKENAKNSLPWITLAADPVSYAAALYAALHDLDQCPASCIFMEAPPTSVEWQAVNDRLKRAATTLY